MPWDWPKESPYLLNVYARQEVEHVLPEGVSSFDLLQEEDGVRRLLRAIYDALRARRVSYALERPADRPEFQIVRKAGEVLGSDRQGTCLDLALLFSSLCLKYMLCPYVIYLRGHALVAVSLRHTLHDWHKRDERAAFDKVVLDRDEQRAKLLELVAREAYLAVECTGFAYSTKLAELGDLPECLDRCAEGYQTFDAAVAAGRRQLGLPAEECARYAAARPFLYAVDVVKAHYYYQGKPAAEAERLARAAPAAGDAGGLPESYDPLPYLLDRSRQEEALRDAVLVQQETKPGRPLVCVIHGDEYEGHTPFVNRIRDRSLPSILDFWLPEEAESEMVLERRVRLSLAEAAGDDCEGLFWKDLAAAITLDPKSSRDTVVNLVSAQKLAVMLNVTLLSSALAKVPLDRIDRFLRFLDGWPKLSGKGLFLVCLSFKYERKFDRPRWLRYLRPRGLNDELRRYVESLDFSRYPNLHGVLLPELRSIERADAEEAVNHSLVRRSYRGRLSEMDVIDLYNSALCTEQGVPMMTVLDKFSRKRLQ